MFKGLFQRVEILQLVLGLLLLPQGYVAHAEATAFPAPKNAANGPWTPNLETVSGQLELLQSITERHPNLPSSNLGFRRNLFTTLAPIPELVKKLGPAAATLEIQPTTALGVQFSGSGEWMYDETKITEIRESLRLDLEKLELKNLRALDQDIIAFKTVLRARYPEKFHKIYPQQLNRLFRLMPYLYDSQGKPIHADLSDESKKTISAEIKASQPSELSNRYLDLFREQKPTLEAAISQANDRVVQASYNTTVSQFVERTIMPGIQPKGKGNGVAAIRTVTLEELPSVIAVFRGCAGSDCSIHSVPYYPIVNGTKIYWVRKSSDFSAQPNGYAFVTSVDYEGKKLPYIITVNGITLTEPDVKKIIQLVGKDWNTNEVIVPDFSINPYVVNSAEIRSSLASEDSTSALVKLPAGWSEIEAYQKQHTNGYYAGYYAETSLSRAKIMQVPDAGSDIIQWISPPRTLRYTPPQKAEALSKIERALLAANATASNSSKDVEEKILASLKIGQRELNLGRIILAATPSKPLTGDSFKKLHEEFGYEIKDLSNLDVLTRSYSIGRIHADLPSATSLEHWKSVVNRANTQLDNQLGQVENRADVLEAVLGAKLQLPPKLAPNRLNTTIPFLEHSNPQIRSVAYEALARADTLPDVIVEKIAKLYSAENPNERSVIEIVSKHPNVWSKPELKSTMQEFLLGEHADWFLYSNQYEQRVVSLIKEIHQLPKDERAKLLIAFWRVGSSTTGNELIPLLSALDTQTLKDSLPKLLQNDNYSQLLSLLLDELLEKERIIPSDPEFKVILQKLLNNTQFNPVWLKNERVLTGIKKAITHAAKLPPADFLDLVMPVWQWGFSATGNELIPLLSALDTQTLKDSLPKLLQNDNYSQLLSLLLDELLEKERIIPSDPEFKVILQKLLNNTQFNPVWLKNERVLTGIKKAVTLSKKMGAVNRDEVWRQVRCPKVFELLH